MKTPSRIGYRLTVISVLCFFPTHANDKDITVNLDFGCKWFGGTSATLTCVCEPEAQMIVLQHSIPAYSTEGIEISNCKSLAFEQNSILDMKNLRRLRLKNIESISFAQNSINWYGYKEKNGEIEERFDITVPGLKVTVTDSNVTLISSHAFAGRINEIHFEGIIFENISPLSFAGLLQTERVVVRNSEIRRIGVHAFRKFSTEYFELENVQTELIPSRAFSNITVYQNVTVSACTFNTLRSGGFSVEHSRIFQVIASNITHLYGEAFKVSSRGTVVFRNNVFGAIDDRAFDGITVQTDEATGAATFLFESNTIYTLYPDALTVSHFFNVKYRNILLREQCDCTSLNDKLRYTEYYEDVKCLDEDDYVTVKEFISNACTAISNYYVTVIIVCVVIVVLVAVVSALVLYYKFAYRRKTYGGKHGNKNGNLNLIVPDGRTYRETELHVIVERADLLTTDL